jgi:transcriptional regulator with XRE-family HTH domain
MGLSGLAEEAGISPSYLSLIENERRRPSLRVVDAIARGLNVPPSVLFWRTSEGNERASTSDSHGLEGLLGTLFAILSELDECQANTAAS